MYHYFHDLHLAVHIHTMSGLRQHWYEGNSISTTPMGKWVCLILICFKGMRPAVEICSSPYSWDPSVGGQWTGVHVPIHPSQRRIKKRKGGLNMTLLLSVPWKSWCLKTLSCVIWGRWHFSSIQVCRHNYWRVFLRIVLSIFKKDIYSCLLYGHIVPICNFKQHKTTLRNYSLYISFSYG